MSNLVEIRWHGRGGQGAKTASLLLADAAFNTGKYIQGFPEYGPERMGAPITAYNRISSSPIRLHSNIYEPDYVVVVDDTLLEDYLYVKIPTIKNNHQFRVADLFVYMMAITYIYHGFEDQIMDSRTKILSILGFNFHVDMNEVAQDIYNRLTSIGILPKEE